MFVQISHTHGDCILCNVNHVRDQATHTAGRMVSRSAYFEPDGPMRETHSGLDDNVYCRSAYRFIYVLTVLPPNVPEA